MQHPVKIGDVFWIRTPYRDRFSLRHLYFLVAKKRNRALLVPVSSLRGPKLAQLAETAPCVLVPVRLWQHCASRYRHPVLVWEPFLRNVSIPHYRYAIDCSLERIRLGLATQEYSPAGKVNRDTAKAIYRGMSQSLHMPTLRSVTRFFDSVPISATPRLAQGLSI